MREGVIDVGGMKLIRRIFGNNSNIACMSAMTDSYCRNASKRNVEIGIKKRREFEKIFLKCVITYQVSI